MKNNHRISLAGFAIAALCAASCASAAGFTMKIAHSAAPGDPRDLGAHKVADILNEKNSCDLKVQVYPSDQLGGSNSMLEQVQIGGVEVMIAPAANLVVYQPLMGILDLPYFWPADPHVLNKVYGGEAMSNLLKTTEKAGFVSVGVWHTGYKDWTSNVPLLDVKDYKGKIVRVMPSKVLYKQNELLGMQNVSMDFGDTYSALQTGTIHAQDNPIPLIYNMKFYEVQKYVNLTDHGILDQVFIISKRWWDKVPADCQSEIRDAVAKGGEVTFEANERLIQEDLKKIRDSGTQVLKPSPEQLSALRNVLEPAVKNYYVELAGGEAQNLVDQFEAEFKRLGVE